MAKRYSFIKKLFGEEELSIRHVKTEHHLADTATKHLSNTQAPLARQANRRFPSMTQLRSGTFFNWRISGGLHYLGEEMGFCLNIDLCACMKSE